ncbi:MAG: ribosomal protection-like ABC-F family protein [Candidatus Bruticola sp.]
MTSIMSLVKLEQVARQFLTEPIWQNISLDICSTERLGIIGANGCGKTSLLRVIGRLDEPDYGRISFSQGLTIGWLPQTPQFNENLSIRETIRNSQQHILNKLSEYENACEAYSINPSRENAQHMEKLSAELNASQAWELNTRIESMISQLNLENITEPIGKLSQGTRKKAAICIALLDNPQLLLLDEPTNHLDTVTIDWLETQLNSFKGAVVMVTHDRYFLDRTVNRILELDKGSGRLYEGNYAKYLEQKAHFLELNQAETEKRANLIRQEMEWFKRGARARSTKQKARQERLAELLEIQQKQKALLSRTQEITLKSMQSGQRLGTKGVDICNISKTYGEHTLFKNFSLKIGKGARLGFVGANGCGKTTLLNIIAENIKPDSGHIEIGETIRRGYYTQTQEQDNFNQTIIDYLRESGDYIVLADGRRVSAENLLEQFLFPRPMQHTLVSKLSGGEQKRLRLLKLLMSNPNCLLLDEPTNDLDIPTLIRLEAWLDNYPNIVIIVSHDRYFLDRCADRLFFFGNGQIQEFAGDYETLRQHISKQAEEQARQHRLLKEAAEKSTRRPSTPPADKQPPAKKKKLTYKQSTRLKELENLITKSENRQSQIEKLLENPTGTPEQMATLGQEFETLGADIEAYMIEWEELASLV